MKSLKNFDEFLSENRTTHNLKPTSKISDLSVGDEVFHLGEWMNIESIENGEAVLVDKNGKKTRLKQSDVSRNAALVKTDESYNPDKKGHEQGDEWDGIFKEYDDYREDASKKGSYKNVLAWLIDKEVLKSNDDPLIKQYRNDANRLKNIGQRWPTFQKWVRDKKIEYPIKHPDYELNTGRKETTKPVVGTKVTKVYTGKM